MYELKVTVNEKEYTANLNKPNRETIAKIIPLLSDFGNGVNPFAAGEVLLNECIIKEQSDVEFLSDDDVYITASYKCKEMFEPIPHAVDKVDGLYIIHIKDEDKEYKLTLNKVTRSVHSQVGPLLSKGKLVAVGEIILRMCVIDELSDKDIIFNNDEYYISAALGAYRLFTVGDAVLKKN